MTSSTRAALMFAALLFSGCKSARTEVLVVVGTDLDYGPGRTVQSVEIEVRSGDSHGPVREHRVVDVGPDGNGLAAMPLSFGLQPLPGSAGAWVRVRACGHDRCQQPEGALVERSAAVGFASGQTRVLNIRLDARCAFVRCAQDQTCDPAVGYCASEVVPASALAEYEQEAGANPSAGAVPELSAGGGYSCLRRADGTVRCWGGAGRVLSYEALTPAGVLPADMSTPLEVAVGGPVEQVDVGYGHACAVRAGGAVACWGDNARGQLGDGTREPRSAAATVARITDAVEVRAGQGFSCARTRDGAVWCWGTIAQRVSDGFGHDLERVLIDSPSPSAIVGVNDAVELAAGTQFACARLRDGGVTCWGTNESGQLGSAPGNPATAARVQGIADAVGIAAGNVHACARLRDGSVQCWGGNEFGQAGNGSVNSVATVATVPGLSGVVAVDAGRWHTCARMRDGSAACWGRNDSGQLGDGTRTDRTLPAVLTAVAGVGEISTGAEHTCVRVTGQAAGDADDAVRCWGSDAAGELGDGRVLFTPVPRAVSAGGAAGFTQVAALGAQTCGVRDGVSVCWGLTLAGGATATGIQEGARASTALPAAVPGLAGAVRDVAMSYGVTCALLASGELRCVGDNRHHELGRASPQGSVVPLAVPGLDGAVQIAGGSTHYCAARADGTAWCWGDDTSGEVGDGVPSEVVTTPTRVSGIADVQQLAAGDHFTCARTRDGAVNCWGQNDVGQLGYVTAGLVGLSPTPVHGLRDAVEVAAERDHACARRAGGEVVCWGNDASAQLGTESLERCGMAPGAPCAHTPLGVDGLPRPAVSVAAGNGFSCAVLDDGSAWCWGANNSAQLGIGRASQQPQGPTRVATGEPLVEITAGDAGACARSAAGNVWCWGDGSLGESGQPGRETSLVPQRVDLHGERAVAVRTHQFRACAIATSGALWCWGSDDSGQLGDGTRNPIGAMPAVGVASAVDVASGYSGGLAALADGTVVSWGSDPPGQLGRGATTPDPTPGLVPGLAGVTQVDQGPQHECARRADGTVACWGDNSALELGAGVTGTSSAIPTTVTGVVGATEVRVGYEHACALDENGDVWCWGGNHYGELGDGGLEPQRSRPERVQLADGPLPPAVGIDCGEASTCAWTAAGELYCWGIDQAGELSDLFPEHCGGFACETRPVRVPVPGRVQQASIEARHACAVVIDASGEHAAYCWGANEWGQLGSGLGSSPPLSFQRVTGLTHVARVGVGYDSSCAVLDDGSVQCWGFNIYGELGTQFGDGFDSLLTSSPVVVENLAGAVDVSLGAQHACARTRDGGVYCWGDNAVGDLGIGRMGSSAVPLAFGGLRTPATARPGFGGGCSAVNGMVQCWGTNPFGQLGEPGPDRDTAQPVPEVSAVQDLAVGQDFACALGSGGIACWGSNVSGSLGVGGAQALSQRPLRVPSEWGPAQLSAGGRHACGVGADGSVWCWGDNQFGQLGFENGAGGETCPVLPCVEASACAQVACATLPTRVGDLGEGAQVAAGGAHTCALGRDGAAYCWGRNDHGQLGDGTFTARARPAAVPGLSNVVWVSAGADTRCEFPARGVPQCDVSGEDHTCAVTADGAVWCWGRNDRGQLGVAPGEDRATPVRVVGLPDAVRFVEVAAGGAHTCARADDGALWCWGDNGYGQLADGTPVTRTEPVSVGGL